jgi:hypothetical protein
VSKPTIGSVRCIPQLMLIIRGTQTAPNEASLNESPSNYIEEMYEQWSKDPRSVHKVQNK